jgi:hypothetical protein
MMQHCKTDSSHSAHRLVTTIYVLVFTMLDMFVLKNGVENMEYLCDEQQQQSISIEFCD